MGMLYQLSYPGKESPDPRTRHLLVSGGRPSASLSSNTGDSIKFLGGEGLEELPEGIPSLILRAMLRIKRELQDELGIRGEDSHHHHPLHNFSYT